MASIGRVSRGVIASSGILLAAMVLVGIVPWRLVAAEPKQDEKKLPSWVHSGKVAEEKDWPVRPLPSPLPARPAPPIPPGAELKGDQVRTVKIKLSEGGKDGAKTVLFAPTVISRLGSTACISGMIDKTRRFEVMVG